MFKRSYLFILVALALLALSPHAWATSTGGGLPMESPLDALKNSLTGPVARDVGLVAIFAALALLIFEGQHMTAFVRGCCFLAMGVGALCNAEPLMNGLGVKGATIATERGGELLQQLLAYGPFAAALFFFGGLAAIGYAVLGSKRDGTKTRHDSPGRN